MYNLAYIVSLGIAIFLGIIGQLFLKTGMMRNEQAYLFLFQPYVMCGLFFYFIAAIFYTYSLKQIPISVAFPSVSISYVAVMFLSHVLWKEPFGLHQIISLLLICSGVFLLYRV